MAVSARFARYLGLPHSEEPCPRCIDFLRHHHGRAEWLQPLPEGTWAPMALDGSKQCFDCAGADRLVRMGAVPDFYMARVAVGNDRSEQLRLPGAPMGLVLSHITKTSDPGDLDRLGEWRHLLVVRGQWDLPEEEEDLWA